MYLGNLNIEEIENRVGVAFPDELRSFMIDTHQSDAQSIKAGKWHCFDVPFVLVCGDLETAQRIHKSLAPYGSKMKRKLGISIDNTHK